VFGLIPEEKKYEENNKCAKNIKQILRPKREKTMGR
jgi:hypothetical protein